MSKGFTIIEIIITIFLLSIAVVGLYSVFAVMLILNSNVSDSFTAASLAQEGVEIARNIRDQNWIRMKDDPNARWYDGLSGCGQGCEYDYKTGTSGLAVPQTGNDHLSLNSDGFYAYVDSGDPNSQTKFERKIKIDFISDHLAKVQVQVSWDKKPNLLSDGVSADYCCPEGAACPANVSNCVTVDDYLYDWY